MNIGLEEYVFWDVHFPLIVCKLLSHPALIGDYMLQGIQQEAHVSK